MCQREITSPRSKASASDWQFRGVCKQAEDRPAPARFRSAHGVGKPKGRSPVSAGIRQGLIGLQGRPAISRSTSTASVRLQGSRHQQAIKVQCICKQAEGLRCQQCVSSEQSQALRHQQASADIRVRSIVSSSQQVHRSCRRQQAIEVRGVGELITNRLPRTNDRSAASASSGQVLGICERLAGMSLG